MNFKSLIVLFLFGVTIIQLSANTIYVSTSGNDNNPGTQAKPVLTFDKAQELARKLPLNESVEVVFGAGIYYLPQTVAFNSSDNKAPGCTVRYRSETEGAAVLSGGNLLKLNWKPYKNGIYVAKINGNTTIDQLYVNGERQRMARFPNAVSGKNVYDAWELSRSATADAATDPLETQRIARWSNPAGGYIHAMHKALWGDMHWVITGKKTEGSLEYEGGWQNNRPSTMHPLYRMVENIFEELDAPTEWFYNASEQNLYFMPSPGIDLKKAKVEIVRLKTLIEFRGTKQQPIQNVQLQGFIFRHTARTFMENKEQLLRSDWTVSRTAAVTFNGATDCSIEDCEFDQVGGNTILVNNYNQRIAIRGCYIHDSGASGVVFVGDPAAVRSPLFRYGKQNFSSIDRTPGPKTDNYPADCVVENCLITRTGRDEKQTAPIQISMSFGIKVRHCSIYDVPRAGININEGTFGGHVIEYCDVFNTVLETGDHGSFNSWGRDRFWTPSIIETVNEVAKDSTMPFWDILAPSIIRNSRWRCDHGWDIDLDDGSTNYLIYNNLMLKGGLKLREGYRRIATNNVMVNNSLHPHVWYVNSGDVFKNNIVFNRYFPARMTNAIPENGKWGQELDYNFFVASEAHKVRFSANGCDLNSAFGEAEFIGAAKGDFRVKENSPALEIGFVNFPMDQFGVKKPSLKAIAKTPEIPALKISYEKPVIVPKVSKYYWMEVELKEPKGEEMSAFGVGFDEGGILLTQVNQNSAAAKAGFQTGDLLQDINGVKIKNVEQLKIYLTSNNNGIKKHILTVIRNQSSVKITINQSLAFLNIN